MNINENVIYIGVNDHKIDLFEGQFDVPNGMAYNSYLIKDEKTAVMDSVDINFGDEWLKNISEALGGASPDYLIVQHMEPDHSANIGRFVEAYPDAKIVGNAKTFAMIKRFFGTDYPDKQVVVKEGETLSLGSCELKFIFAPMVHWPEVMMTYIEKYGILFTADAFGKFGALDVDEDWACEARRYYFGIVGKYGMQVQNLLKKAAALDIKTICPLHGPVLSEDLEYYLDLYVTWSSYGVESDGLFIAYTSVYGNTKKAAELLKEKLEAKGCPKVAIADLAREDMAESVEDAFRYGKLVLATTTYNADIFPFMRTFIEELVERGYQNRTIGIIENGTWAPMAAKVIKSKFEKSKNITFTDTTVTVASALNAESEAQIEALADELV
ncbi:MAG: FprA family A-type flavoprotein [Ruminococcus sp.]|nr:FprA family A-type flavoprotein [Ruminococcus sp.]